MEDLQKLQQNNIAFVLGNGISRSVVDPKSLLSVGKVYGCNAQYREYEPHYLIAVDVKMVNEIVMAGYHRDHEVWTNPNKGVTSKKGINFFHPHKGWSSGPTALWLSSCHGYKEIYILGFDYQGTNGKFNNVYANTPNYKKSTDSATFFGNWLNQTEKVIKEFKNIKYYRLINDEGFVPEKLIKSCPNLEHISYRQFFEKFPNAVYSAENNQKTTI
jgi:hypothetical protein